jgi:hypothetical protein
VAFATRDVDNLRQREFLTVEFEHRQNGKS